MPNFRKSLFLSAVSCLAVFFLFIIFLSPAIADLNQVKLDLEEAIQTMPESSPLLHQKILDAGKQFEEAGQYSQARRYYKFLDILWEQYPAENPNDQKQLKVTIASLKRQKDSPQNLSTPNNTGKAVTDSQSVPDWMLNLPPLPTPQPVKLREDLDLRGISRIQYNGIVSQAKETVAELLGDMPAEQQKAYDKAWQPMYVFPAPVCIEYLEKIIPVAEQALSLRLALIDTMKTNAEMWEIAGYIEVYNPQEAEKLMLQVRDRTVAIRSMKRSMDQLIKEIEDLGNPPNPEELQQARQKRHQSAFRNLESLLAGAPELDGYYELLQRVRLEKDQDSGKFFYAAEHNVQRLHTLAIKPLKATFGDIVIFSELSYNEPSEEGTFGSLFNDMFEPESWNAWFAEKTEDGWVNYSYDPEDGMIDVNHYRVSTDRLIVDNFTIMDGEITGVRSIYHRAPLTSGVKLFEDGETEESVNEMIVQEKEAVQEGIELFHKGKAAIAQYSDKLPRLYSPQQIYWVLKDVKTAPDPQYLKDNGSAFSSFDEVQVFEHSYNTMDAAWVHVETEPDYADSSDEVDLKEKYPERVDALGQIIPAGTPDSQYVASPDEEEEPPSVYGRKEQRKKHSASLYWEPAPAVLPDNAFWLLDPKQRGDASSLYIGGRGAALLQGPMFDQPKSLLVLEDPVHADEIVKDETVQHISSILESESESTDHRRCLSLRSERILKPEIAVYLTAATGVGTVDFTYLYEQRVLTEDEARELASRMEGNLAAVSYSDAVKKRQAVQDFQDSSEDALAEARELKKQRIALHKANIAYAKRNANKLKRELDEKLDLFKAGKGTRDDIEMINSLQFRLASEESNAVDEADKLRAEETGVYSRTRTPFDDLCRAQMIQKCEKSVRDITGGITARKRAEFQISHIKDETQRRKALKLLSEVTEKGSGLYAEDYAKLNKSVDSILAGEFDAKMARIDDDIAWKTLYVDVASNVKTGAEVGLALTGMAGGPMYVNVAYQTAAGYIKGGPKEALIQGIKTYSDAADIMISGYEGWQQGGVWGAVEGASWSILMNKGPEVAMGRLNFGHGFDGGYGPIRMEGPGGKIESSYGSARHVPDPDAPRLTADDISRKGRDAIQGDRMKQELEYGEALAKDYFRDYNRMKQAEIKGDMDPDELKVLRMQVRQKAAAVAHSMPAKSYLKYKAPPRVGAAYTEMHSELLDDALAAWRSEMRSLGYSDQELNLMRNLSSMDASMDSDMALNEARRMIGEPNPDDLVRLKNGEITPGEVRYSGLTRNGETLTLNKWEHDANRVLAANYKHVTGGYNAKQSFVEVTTSAGRESYRDLNWLMVPKVGKHSDLPNVQRAQDRIFGQLDPKHFSHDFNITPKKAEIMMQEHPEFTPLHSLMESCRGTAKDLDTKFIPIVDSKIRSFENLPENQLTPDVLAQIKELKATKQHLADCSEVFADIGKGNSHPSQWMNDFRMVTGGEDPHAVIQRLSHMAHLSALQ